MIDEIIEKYKIECDKNEIVKFNECTYILSLDNGKKVIFRFEADKAKIAWEYKTLMNLQGKINVPKIYKINDEIITECIAIELVNFNLIETYEDKEEYAFAIGEEIAKLHITEINEQTSFEELRNIWHKYILNKNLLFGTKIIGILSEEFQNKVFEYMNENLSIIKKEFKLSKILGKYDMQSFIKLNDNVQLINFSNSMIGDPVYDLALVFDYYYQNKKMIQKVIEGYESIINLPDYFEEKISLFTLMINLEKLIANNEKVNSEKDNNEKNDDEIKEKVRENNEHILELIKSILDGKYSVK